MRFNLFGHSEELQYLPLPVLAKCKKCRVPTDCKYWHCQILGYYLA